MKYILIAIVLLFACVEDMPYDDPNPFDPTAYPDVKNGERLDLVWKAERVLKVPNEYGGLQSLKFGIDGDKIIVARDFFIECFDKNNGELVWRTEVTPISYYKKISFDKSNEMIIENNIVYIIGQNKIYTLNLQTGDLIWEYTSAGKEGFAIRHESLTHSKDALYYSVRGVDDPAYLYALSKSDGFLLWKTEQLIKERLGSPGGVLFLGPPAYSPSNNRIYLGTKSIRGGYYSGTIICVDAENGAKIWEKNVAQVGAEYLTNGLNEADYPMASPTDAHTEPKIVDNGIVFRAGKLVCKMDFDGNLIWASILHLNGITRPNRQSGGELIGNSFFDFSFFSSVGSYGGEFDINTGKMIWSSSMSSKLSPGTSLAFYTNHYDPTTGTIYIVTDGAELVGIDKNTKKRTWDLSLARQQYWEDDKWNKAEFWGSYTVEGDRVYFLGTKYIFCYQRIPKEEAE